VTQQEQLLTDIKHALGDLPERLWVVLNERKVPGVASGVTPPTPAKTVTPPGDDTAGDTPPVSPESKPNVREEEKEEEPDGKKDLDTLISGLGKMGGLVPQLGELASKLRNVQRFFEGIEQLKTLWQPPKTPGVTPVTPAPPKPATPGTTESSSPPKPGTTESSSPPKPGKEWDKWPIGPLSHPDVKTPEKSGVAPPTPAFPKPPLASENEEEQRTAPKKTFGRGEEEDMPTSGTDSKNDALAEAIESLADAVKALERKIGKDEGGKRESPSSQPSQPSQPGRRSRASGGTRMPSSSGGKAHAVERAENTINFGEQLGNVLGKAAASEGAEAAAAL
jgi:hypothetical protein